MTVKEVRDKLNELIAIGHADTRVICYADFVIDGVHYERPFCHLEDIYYQSGDIEFGFTDGVDND